MGPTGRLNSHQVLGLEDDVLLVDPEERRTTTATAPAPDHDLVPTVRTTVDSNLVEARPVIENLISQRDLQEARELDAEELERKAVKEQKEQQCRRIGYLVIAIAMLIIGISLGFGLQPEITETAAPPTIYLSVEPSQSPSMAPTGGLDLLLVGLPNHTRASILVLDSPQQKAFEWLSGHQNMTTLPEGRKRQLFVLATFYYAMDGPTWRPEIRDNWMVDTKHECDWWSSSFGSFDSETGGRWSETTKVLSEPCNNASEFQAINLDDLQLYSLEARMPPEIALLTSLRSISLYNNSINASLDDFLPSELYQLTNLTQLNLASNHHLKMELPNELEAWADVPLFPLSLSNYTLHGKLPGG
jgi:hypothetical protein